MTASTNLKATQPTDLYWPVRHKSLDLKRVPPLIPAFASPVGRQSQIKGWVGVMGGMVTGENKERGKFLSA